MENSLMSRTTSSATLFIKSVLENNPEARFEDVASSADYAAGGHDFNNTYFNAIKCRFKKENGIPVMKSAGYSVPFVLPAQVSVPPPAPVVVTTSINTGDMVPPVDNNFHLGEEVTQFFELVQQISQTKNVNIRLVGPAGCGKTSSAVQYAASKGYPCFVQNCANVREPRDWFGYRKLDENKNLAWHESLFVKMLETPNAVIVLDETNRCPSHTLNTLYPLLDHRRATWLEEAGRNLQVAEGVTFWCALNEGNQFTGTNQLDEAFADRTGLVLECTFLSAKNEAKVLEQKTGLDADNCLRLVEVAEQVRKKAQSDSADSFSKPVSTRMLEEAAQAFVVGGSKTLKFTLLNHYSASGGNNSERQNLLKLLIGKFGAL
jgi:hypothetical protein